MSSSELDRVVTERVELRPVSLDLARVLADPQASDSGSQSWAAGYPLPGSRVAARNFVQQAEAAAGGDRGKWGMFQMILRETGEVIGDIGSTDRRMTRGRSRSATASSNSTAGAA